jgi:hypothetical protein
MFECKWTLLVRVTPDATRISTGCQSGLLQLKAAMRVVTVTASHRALENLVMEGLVKVGFHLVMTAHAKLWVTHLQQMYR